MYDIIIIGGGPAGMTAALYAQRNGKSALVIEKNGFGGQITHSPKVENYPGTLQMSGNEFADRMLDQILAQGAEIEIENAVAVEDLGEVKVVVTEEGSAFEGRAVVIATGVKHRMLGLEGEDELVGEGISFCAVCDGDFYSGQRVCVAGGGNSALQEAVLLSEKCSEVVILQDLPALTGEQKLQDALAARDNVRIDLRHEDRRPGHRGRRAEGRGDLQPHHRRKADRRLRRAVRGHRPDPRERALRGAGRAERLGLLRLRRALPDEDPRRVRGGGLPQQGRAPADHRRGRRRHRRAGGVPVYRYERILRGTGRE